jgi:hypothetical protein
MRKEATFWKELCGQILVGLWLGMMFVGCCQ